MKHFNHRRFRHVKPVPTGSPARRPAEHRRGDRQRIQRIQRRSGGGVSSCGLRGGCGCGAGTENSGDGNRDGNWRCREFL